MGAESMRALKLIERAKLAFELGLMSESTMTKAIARAENDPDYNGWDLPSEWEVRDELEARKASDRRANGGRLRRAIRSLLGV